MEQCSIGNALKLCPNCNRKWCSTQSMLSDPAVTIIGYQPHFEVLTLGLIYFNHDCDGTFTVNAKEFADLYTGPIFQQRKAGTEQCPGHCQHRTNLERCPMECECAYIREIIQIIKSWPKTGQ